MHLAALFFAVILWLPPPLPPCGPFVVAEPIDTTPDDVSELQHAHRPVEVEIWTRRRAIRSAGVCRPGFLLQILGTK